MYFTKYPHPANFTYAEGFDPTSGDLSLGKGGFRASIEVYEGEIYHVSVGNPNLWGPNKCLETLRLPEPSSDSRLSVDSRFNLRFRSESGGHLLSSPEGKGFGISGESWLFRLNVGSDARFYGMGEKTFGRMELSGLRTKFWNTDAWSDFHHAHYSEHPVDPPYFSLPYVVIRHGSEYIGVLLHNPYATFFETPGSDETRAFAEWKETSRNFIAGSEGGQADIWILYGPSLPELTRKLQRMVGLTPRPPTWALGYHQSRWGYGGHEDLLELDRRFAAEQIPCDSLWLDLDYMVGYRIFKTSEEMFPTGVEDTALQLAKNGRRIVPIIDPGVKFDPGYAVYDDGHEKGVFCRNPEGREFIGMVWPGETVFPDFSMDSVRDWWADYVKQFACEGFGAAWVDMNDPSTGPVDPDGMLFQNGTEPHAAFHNQYALGMQMASRGGFLKARPHERPFLLSRSGFIGSSLHSAIWTGDNLSNYAYLAQSVPTSVGMSISGLPFNGADVGGFGGDADEQLILDWFKSAFLFPFMRNHAVKGCRQQEPYAYPARTAETLRRYIRLRYKFIPYLYNLFIEQERDGDPILRPLFYHFDAPELDLINDQFLVGPFVLQAPFLDRATKLRDLVLPGTEPWYDASTGDWTPAGSVTVKRSQSSTPLYFRAGAVVPLQAGTPTDNTKELRKVNFHVFVPEAWNGETTVRYRADDGISFAYQTGKESEIVVKLLSVDGHLAVVTEQMAEGYGAIEPTFVVHGTPKSLRVDGHAVAIQNLKVTLTGKALPVQVVR